MKKLIFKYLDKNYWVVGNNIFGNDRIIFDIKLPDDWMKCENFPRRRLIIEEIFDISNRTGKSYLKAWCLKNNPSFNFNSYWKRINAIKIDSVDGEEFFEIIDRSVSRLISKFPRKKRLNKKEIRKMSGSGIKLWNLYYNEFLTKKWEKSINYFTNYNGGRRDIDAYIKAMRGLKRIIRLQTEVVESLGKKLIRR